MRTLPLLTTALLLGATTVHAQSASAGSSDKAKTKAGANADADSRVTIERGLRNVYIGRNSTRAMLGVSTSATGKRDTLGLLVTSVTPNGPAEKAGIVEGNRIASINGVNLRLAAADAGEDDMRGIAAHRLTRELGKVEPGAEVELRVYADGQWKTMRVKTVARDSLMPARYIRSREADDRAVLGFQLSGTGSKRDTLGVMIGSLTADGPAEKAGLVEGDRVAAVNGTELRVSREDVGDDWVSSTMVNRFQRVMRDVKPGDKVQLRVYSGGQVRNVTVTAAKASDIYKNNARFRFFSPDVMGFEGGDFGPALAPLPPMPPMPPMPAGVAPRIRINTMDMDDDDLDLIDDDVLDDADVTIDVDRAVEAARAAERAAADRRAQPLRMKAAPRALMSSAKSFVAATPALAAVWSTDDAPESATIAIPGLTLAPVTPELAEYLGKGSENGYLVLEAAGPWADLHAGDVVISVDGAAVRDGDLSSDGHDLVVLRKGRKLSLHM